MKKYFNKVSDSELIEINDVCCPGILNYLWILLVYFILVIAGCAPQTKTSTLSAENPEAFSESGDQELIDRWWHSFNDPQLNRLVDSALINNFDLLVAWQRLRESRAIARRESASLFPWLDASAGAELNRPESRTATPENYHVALTASYEVDLWGRLRSQAKAAAFRAEASRLDYRAAAISLSAEISSIWFRLMETQSQLRLIDKQIRTNEKVLRLLKARFGSGQIRSVDILRQKQLLESTREQKVALLTDKEILKNRLAVLMGKPPQEPFSFRYDSLPLLPPIPDAGLPAELVQRRPDVQSAFKLLRAADRDMASAISNQYPRLSLSASLSASAGNAQDLFDNWVSSFAGNLIAPLMYAGQRKEEVNRTEAAKKQRLYQYGQSILTAFQEVENALIQEKQQLQRISSIKLQLEMARKSYKQLRLEYFNGMSNYLDVLTALDEEQRLQRNLLSANLALLEYRVGLYRALAGGFETSREETTDRN